MPFQPGTHMVQLGEMLVRRSLTLQNDARTAAAPPTVQNNRVSVMNRRARRQYPAPRAVRTAISFWRATIRAKKRLARLEHARSNTNAAAACSSTNNGRVYM